MLASPDTLHQPLYWVPRQMLEEDELEFERKLFTVMQIPREGVSVPRPREGLEPPQHWSKPALDSSPAAVCHSLL